MNKEPQATLTIWPHYKVEEIKGTNDEVWQQIKEIFPDNKADNLNWIFGSTSGVHGSYITLDKLADPEYWKEFNEDKDPEDHIDRTELDFTFLIIQPRLCVMYYGTLYIRNDEDSEWLKTVITSSVKAVAESQEGNLL